MQWGGVEAMGCKWGHAHGVQRGLAAECVKLHGFGGCRHGTGCSGRVSLGVARLLSLPSHRAHDQHTAPSPPSPRSSLQTPRSLATLVLSEARRGAPQRGLSSPPILILICNRERPS